MNGNFHTGPQKDLFTQKPVCLWMHLNIQWLSNISKHLILFWAALQPAANIGNLTDFHVAKSSSDVTFDILFYLLKLRLEQARLG